MSSISLLAAWRDIHFDVEPDVFRLGLGRRARSGQAERDRRRG